MTHLSPDELIDIIDGTASESVRRHAQACESCRASAADLRGVVALAAADEVPEPSPLFWDHLSGRVSGAVRREPALRPWWRVGVWRWAPATAAVVVLAVALGVLLSSDRRSQPPLRGTASVSVTVAREQPVPDAVPEPEGDTPWMLMGLLTSDLSVDDVVASELGPGPSSLDRAAEQLSEVERVELVRLLREELGEPRQ